jgi:hypothetical protein
LHPQHCPQEGEVNGERYLAALGETEVTMYKWE